MPDDTDSEIPASGVVIVSLEDGAGDTIRPRLEEAGADLSRVRIIQTILGDDGHERTPTIPVDLPAIELAIKDVEAGLLIIDPLFATLGADTNSHRDQDVRRALAPLASLAERTRVAVIAVRHLNKGSNPNPKYRGGGSIGIIGAARAALVFAKDPQDDAFFVMAPSKMNLCALPPALRYRLEAKGAVVAVVWEGASPHTAESLLAQPESDEETGAISDAKRFLRDVLAEGPREVKENKREARNLGVSVRTLGRAKALLRIEPRKVGFGEGQHWEWELTEGCQARPEECQSR